jgi:adenine-specific DNA-methyltransferase
MDKLTAESPETKSPNLAAENLAKLKALFPEVVTEDGVNVDALKQLIGKTVTDAEEKYGLNWHGKRKSRQLALTPSTGTLRPCPQESVDWEKTRNLMIEGDNLEVLKLLQKSYAGKVKCIFIDPPYNTGGDFVYEDDFQDNIRNYLELTGQVGEGGRKITSNTETSGRFHTDWLNMMYPRLKLARNLLTDDGTIFITIDDNEVDNLRKLCSEIFGEENFVAQIEWQKRYTRSNNTDDFTSVIDHLVVYRKSDKFKPQLMERDEEANARYQNPDNDPRGSWKAIPFLNPLSPEERPNLAYTIKHPSGRPIQPKKKAWRSEEAVWNRLVEEKRVWWGTEGDSEIPNIKRFLTEVRQGMTPINFWDYQFAGHTDIANQELKDLFEDKVFDTPKPTRLIQRVMQLAAAPDEPITVLDFFAGSGTTGHAVYDLNLNDHGLRRFILVQLPEPTDKPGYPSIADITKERLRRAAKKTRAAWEAQQAKAAAVEPDLLNPRANGQQLEPPDLGFRVFKLASSNIQAWEPDRERLAETLEASVDHLKTDRTESDILFEVLLKLGLDLTVPIEKKSIASHEVHSIGAGTLLVCLSKSITAKEVEPLALGIADWHKTQATAGESSIVFRDSAFADDVAKTNLAAILQQHGLENVRSL